MSRTFERAIHLPDDMKFSDVPQVLKRYVDILTEAQSYFGDAGSSLDGVIEGAQVKYMEALFAAYLLEIYWLPGEAQTDDKRRGLAAEILEDSHGVLSPNFYFLLIEMAGERALRTGVSKQMAAAAKAKNREPRAWVLEQWNGRQDKGQSKASFARQYAGLVKARFGVDVTPDQIARVWLPKG